MRKCFYPESNVGVSQEGVPGGFRRIRRVVLNERGTRVRGFVTMLIHEGCGSPVEADFVHAHRARCLSPEVAPIRLTV